jgi:hypothetical protein
MRAYRLLHPPRGVCHLNTRCQNSIISTFRSRPHLQAYHFTGFSTQPFSSTRIWRRDQEAERAKAPDKNRLVEHERGFHRQIDNAFGEAKELQRRTPWHREGTDKPPVKKMRNAGAMTKGGFSLHASRVRDGFQACDSLPRIVKPIIERFERLGCDQFWEFLI